MFQRTTKIARSLRRRTTDAEQCLWRQLRGRRLAGLKFKRQQPIGPYIVDFVCFTAGVVVEVDGGQHLDSESDAARDAWLQKRGYRILRFWNNEVLTNTTGVLERIAEVLCAPSPRPSPARGEGDQSADL